MLSKCKKKAILNRLCRLGTVGDDMGSAQAKFTSHAREETATY
jgi:hypothetical protein